MRNTGLLSILHAFDMVNTIVIISSVDSASPLSTLLNLTDYLPLKDTPIPDKIAALIPKRMTRMINAGMEAIAHLTIKRTIDEKRISKSTITAFRRSEER